VTGNDRERNVQGVNISIPAAAAGPQPRMHGRTALRNGCGQHSPSPLRHPSKTRCSRPQPTYVNLCGSSVQLGL